MLEVEFSTVLNGKCWVTVEIGGYCLDKRILPTDGPFKKVLLDDNQSLTVPSLEFINRIKEMCQLKGFANDLITYSIKREVSKLWWTRYGDPIIPGKEFNETCCLIMNSVIKPLASYMREKKDEE